MRFKHKDLIFICCICRQEPLKKIDTDVKNRLRTVKSAESLISGVNSTSVRNSTCLEYLSPPSPKLSGPSGHSRSVSHDSYFDHLAEITPIHSTLHQDQEGHSCNFNTIIKNETPNAKRLR